MAFRKKAKYITQLKPDILVIPECECPEKLIFENCSVHPSQIIWHGSNSNKGLGIFSFGKYRITELDCHNPDIKLIIPLHITNEIIHFNLFAIWANNTSDKRNQYVGQIWKALHHYETILSNDPVILTGDFNSNTIWDQPLRTGNHSHVVEKLKSKEIHSCYHSHLDFEQGKEKHPTLFMYRNINKGYHIDYCFASKIYIQKLVNVEVGKFRKWGKYSDHMPLIIDFNLGE